MTSSNSPNEAFGVEATSAEEMRAFDSLPEPARTLLNYAAENYSAVLIARAPTGGNGGGGVFVIRHNTRDALLRAIEQREAAKAPLKIVRRKCGKCVKPLAGSRK